MDSYTCEENRNGTVRKALFVSPVLTKDGLPAKLERRSFLDVVTQCNETNLETAGNGSHKNIEVTSDAGFVVEQNSEEKKPVVSEKSDTVNNAPVSTGKIIKFNIDPEVAAILQKQNSEKEKPVASKSSVAIKKAPVSTGQIIKFNIDPEVAAILRNQNKTQVKGKSPIDGVPEYNSLLRDASEMKNAAGAVKRKPTSKLSTGVLQKSNGKDAKKMKPPTVIINRPTGAGPVSMVRKTLFKPANAKNIRRSIPKKVSIPKRTPLRTPKISEPEKPFDPLSLTAAKRVLASRSGAKHDPSPAEDSFLLLENQCRSVKKSATRKSRIRITGINSLQLEQVNDNVTTAVRNILDSVKKEREELKAEIDNRFDFIETNLVNLLHALDTFGGSNGEVVIPN